jgi:hypothetical protein
VSKEMKPIALIAIPDREIDQAKKIIKSINLKYELINLCDGWKSLYIYKYKYFNSIIKELPDNPKTIYEHWILGKAFGYSDSSIGEFLKTIV